MKGAVFLALFAVAAFTTNAAEAADYKKTKASKAEKVIKVLSYVNLDLPYVQGAAYYLDENIKDGYLNLSEQQINDLGGIKMQIRYDIDKVDLDNLQMRMYHDDSNFELIGNREGAYLSYKIEF